MRLTSAERAEIIFNLVKNALASSASVSPHCRVNCLDAAVYGTQKMAKFILLLHGTRCYGYMYNVDVCIIVKYYPRNMWNSDASEFSLRFFSGCHCRQSVRRQRQLRVSGATSFTNCCVLFSFFPSSFCVDLTENWFRLLSFLMLMPFSNEDIILCNYCVRCMLKPERTVDRSISSVTRTKGICTMHTYEG